MSGAHEAVAKAMHGAWKEANLDASLVGEEVYVLGWRALSDAERQVWVDAAAFLREDAAADLTAFLAEDGAP